MTRSGGKRTRMRPFLSSLYIVHSQGASSPPSRLELFGLLGFQLGLASLDGRRPGAGSSPLTAWRDSVGASPIGAFCANMRRKPQITFSCFVRRLECYGFWSFPFLGCNGWCTPLWKGTSLDGMDLSWARKRRKLGELSPSSECGPFGKKGIGGSSMILRGMTKILNPFFCTRLWIGLGCI